MPAKKRSKLELAVAKAVESVQTMHKQTEARRLELAEAKRQLEAAERVEHDAAVTAGWLGELVIIERGLTAETSQLMQAIVTHNREAGDLTQTGLAMAESRRLAREAKDKLLHVCKHPFLHHRKRDYRSWDSDHDTEPGRLTCLVCGYEEKEVPWSHTDSEESYKVLATGDHLFTHYLGDKVELATLPKPIPWETIRGFFIHNGMRKAAAAIGHEIK